MGLVVSDSHNVIMGALKTRADNLIADIDEYCVKC
jgi:hypothetical protein